jgi:nucleotide-binding universal stress UspA family protein
MYKNILLPTDGLGKCVFGTCHGIIIAKSLGAKITAVHITEKLSAKEILEMYQPEVLFSPSDVKKAKEAMSQKEETQKEMASKSLEVAQKMCTDVGVSCETVHITGESPVDGILKVAKEKKCDLIFISTHGNPGIMGTLFGTLATKIMTHSKYPVLVHYCGGPT